MGRSHVSKANSKSLTNSLETFKRGIEAPTTNGGASSFTRQLFRSHAVATVWHLAAPPVAYFFSVQAGERLEGMLVCRAGQAAATPAALWAGVARAICQVRHGGLEPLVLALGEGRREGTRPMWPSPRRCTAAENGGGGCGGCSRRTRDDDKTEAHEGVVFGMCVWLSALRLTVRAVITN